MSLSQIKGNVDVKLWTPLHEVESEALTQLRNVAALPWVYHHVAAMADVHAGKGCTVGSVIAMKDAVAPAAVGVDVGCGMAAIATNLCASALPDDLTKIRHQVERDIPVGNGPEGGHEHAYKGEGDLLRTWNGLFDRFSLLHQSVEDQKNAAQRQCGTLGGGNHFIELCLSSGRCETCDGTGTILEPDFDSGVDLVDCYANCDNGKTDQRVWLMLHSGSRNIGKRIAEAHIKIAKTLEHNQRIVDRDMAVFLAGTPEMEAYRRDLYWAQEYAFLNRRVMIALYQNALKRFFPQITFGAPILCHHNYVAEEVHFGEKVFVTRKGAINAEKGMLGIIPGSMGTRSYIVRGLGNPESFNSASHGAGRRMSRGQAKRQFTLADLEQQTAGVCCRKDHGVLDEIPGAYKDIDQVMANQSDLVEVVTELKAVMCIKG